MWLIVGLGNPGAKYELTRHNFGFLAIDALLEKQGISSMKSGFSGQTMRSELAGNQCVFLKPETFMNRSGTSVQQAMAFHKIPLSNVVVMHDELDLPMGDARIKIGGGVSGHNGLKDIARLVGPDFVRVRLGIGRPSIRGCEADYVLSPFSNQELITVSQVIDRSVAALSIFLTEGLDAAQRQLNIRTQKTS